MTLLCGRYEGFDERIVTKLCTDAVSVGPFVLAGGELAAMTVMDAMLRKLPGALGHADSAVEESFSEERMAALETECVRLVGLGARRLRRVEPDPPLGAGFIVMADPEDNEFCLD